MIHFCSQFTSCRHAIAMLLSARSNYFTAWTDVFFPGFSFIFEQLVSGSLWVTTTTTVADPEFSWSGPPTAKLDLLTYYFANFFCRKWNNLNPEEGRTPLPPPLDPPMHHNFHHYHSRCVCLYFFHCLPSWNLIRLHPIYQAVFQVTFSLEAFRFLRLVSQQALACYELHIRKGHKRSSKPNICKYILHFGTSGITIKQYSFFCFTTRTRFDFQVVSFIFVVYLFIYCLFQLGAPTAPTSCTTVAGDIWEPKIDFVVLDPVANLSQISPTQSQALMIQ